MTHQPHDNFYLLLARLLTPDKDEEQIAALRESLTREVVPWGGLVYLANLHLCTPLWYVCLRDDGLMDLLPPELQEYLTNIYQLNLTRNQGLMAALRELMPLFAEQGIEVILLKGAATFCDDLYSDVGARMMQDIDLLVRPPDTEAARDLLQTAGYVEIREEAMEFDGLPTDRRHHHIHLHHKPGTPVNVEVHYRTGYARVGEVLPAPQVWQTKVEWRFEKLEVSLPSPTNRLIHNTAHALEPQAEFIKANVSLLQLAEFVYLARRYQEEISWSQWLDRGRIGKMEIEFLAYLTLAHNFLGLEWPTSIPVRQRAGWEAFRLATAARLQGRRAKGFARFSVRDLLTRILLKTYYFCNLPAWAWRNVCYTGEKGDIGRRLAYLARKVASQRSRSRI